MEKWLSMWSIGPDVNEETWKRIKAAGFVGIEVWGEHDNIFETVSKANTIGLKTGCHLPFSDLNLADDNDEKADKAVGMLTQLLEKLGTFGCEHAVLHGGKDSGKRDWNVVLDKMAARLSKLQKTAAAAQVTLLLENLIPEADQRVVASNFADWQYLLGKTGLHACLDVGHLRIAGGNLKSALAQLGERLYAVHYSENDGVSDLHLMAEKDTSYLRELLAMLRKIQYSGTFTFEVHPSHYTWKDILNVASEVQQHEEED
ncbi:sugar phosphate isomerase/epimerase family protein [Virgibacillus halophilus]|uniref:Sugar phosphate isomerase/epimerase family protein n=1 Tax=Tigheibacillus halophilus TaxID=361280 RepID=A0ABU5C5Q4_9BACI|nr:sugar phosphate isomerase/epimerase family protein [Virgibacillus halophilus]